MVFSLCAELLAKIEDDDDDEPEKNLARRPTGYIPTPANANFALGSDAVRGQLKVLYPARLRPACGQGRNPIGLNAMKTHETWN